MKDVVASPSEMTPGWFTEVLSGSGALGSGRVISAKIDRIGHGMLARMVRAELTYDLASAGPSSVVVKFPSDDAGSLQVARAMGLYEHEALFYRDIAPMLEGVSIPRCYSAVMDQHSGLFTLVLEDLSGRNKPGDALTPCTLDQCAAALAELGKLQALLWNAESVSKLAWLADPQRTHAVFDSLPAGLAGFLARFGRGLSREHVSLFEAVLPRAGEWVRSWKAPTVIQHGDFRSDNLMFGAAPGAAAATMIDFQTVRLGPPGLDPAYFLASCLPTEERRVVEHDLITAYHRQLVQHGVEDFDFDACWRAYREGAMYGIFLFVGMAAQVESTERGDRLIVEQIRRFADAALDLDAPRAAGLT